MRRSLVAALAVSALVLVLTGTVQPFARSNAAVLTATGSQHVRVERVFKHGPAATYESDYGALGALEIGKVRMPSSRYVDVVVSLTFDYRVSEGDVAVVNAFFGDDAKGPFVKMRPRRYRLTSPGGTTATTLVFAKHNVRGAGRTYDFLAGANIVRTTGCCASVGTSHVLAVIDVWPAGPR